MKELDINKMVREKPKMEVSQEKEQEYKLVYQDTIIPHPGHTLFEIDIVTLDVKEAEYIYNDYVFNPFWKKGDKAQAKGEVLMNEGKAYVSALNKSNALKKFKKDSNGTKINPNGVYLSL